MRYKVVSDLPEWTVHDTESGVDLFPTRSRNRTYACRYGCGENTAHMIADALNEVASLRAELAVMRRKQAHGCADVHCPQCDIAECLGYQGAFSPDNAPVSAHAERAVVSDSGGLE